MDNNDAFIIDIEGRGDILPNMIATVVITTALAIAAVYLRFLARRLSRGGLWWDDWLIIPALLLVLGEAGVQGWWFSLGGGRYIGEATPWKVRGSLIVYFVSTVIYGLTTFFVRFSVLLLYQRVFTQRGTRIYSIVMMVINFLEMVSVILISCLYCQPITGRVDMSNPSTCPTQAKHTMLGYTVANILLDIGTICPPLFLVWRLNLNKRAKVLVCGAIVSGLLVTVISAVRIPYIVLLRLDDLTETLNFTWTYAPIDMWTVAELNLGIVSACLPCLRPLLTRVTSLFSVTKPSMTATSEPALINRSDSEIREQNTNFSDSSVRQIYISDPESLIFKENETPKAPVASDLSGYWLGGRNMNITYKA